MSETPRSGSPAPEPSDADAPPVIEPALVALDVDLGTTPASVIDALATTLAENGRADSAAPVARAAVAREETSATGLPGGIAIPHCRIPEVRAASLAFARLAPGVDFGAPDGPADLVFLIAAPEGAGSAHMKLLSSLARALVRPDFVASLRAARTPEELVSLVEGVLPAGSAPASATASSASAAPTATDTAATGTATGTAATGTAATTAAGTTDTGGARRRIVAVTACPTGIAHTYMAADALTAAGERDGIEVQVETQGSSGSTPLSAADIAAADAVVFATDVGVKGRERFAGKPVVESGVKRAINEPAVMLAEALEVAADPAGARIAGTPGASADSAGGTGGELGWGTRLRQILLTGVSYMIPFVAAGGLLIALGFLFGGASISENGADIAVGNSLTDLPDGGLRIYIAAVLVAIGQLAFSFLVPALSGYIAYAIADRPGLAPGFTAGAVAVAVGAGFIGGLVGGLIAGFAALYVSRIPVPVWARGLMPVVVIPLLSSLIVGVLMFVVLGRPLAAITSGLTNWLNGLSGGSAVLLGLLLGLMMCFDLGGPVNKAAYSFAVAGLSVSNVASMEIMAAVMAAGMVPPLAMALSTLVRPALYSAVERENGKAAWLLGASFISEGAIPFAAADPLRVIPSMMAGGAVTGAMLMAGGVTLSAPHGGIFVLFAIGGIPWFLLSLVAGTVVAALCVTIAKQTTGRRAVATTTDSDIVTAGA